MWFTFVFLEIKGWERFLQQSGIDPQTEAQRQKMLLMRESRKKNFIKIKMI